MVLNFQICGYSIGPTRHAPYESSAARVRLECYW